jgi:chaperone modulatory protein CbpM
MMTDQIVSSELLGDRSLTVEELALASGTAPQWIITRVEAALIVARDGEPASWRFGSDDLRRARRLAAAEHMFEINEEAAAFIVDLIEEIDRLRRA